jgi:hypothetical protein
LFYEWAPHGPIGLPHADTELQQWTTFLKKKKTMDNATLVIIASGSQDHQCRIDNANSILFCAGVTHFLSFVNFIAAKFIRCTSPHVK